MSVPDTLQPGTHVIIAHPHFDHAHVVATIANRVIPTAKMVELRYLMSRDPDVLTSRRRRSAIMSVIPDGTDPYAVAEALAEARSAHTAEARKAEDNYKMRILQIVGGTL